ncbi:MAG: hypothetical protein F6J93_35825 [Oscillatoria sp. SIO1A7]|nr:hypothetical protein [Oscillatoria sp. SIO1A7]
MILTFSNGEPFATGAIRYDYRPATERETTNRMILAIDIEGYITEAVVDTGAPYSVIAPQSSQTSWLR